MPPPYTTGLHRNMQRLFKQYFSVTANKHTQSKTMVTMQFGSSTFGFACCAYFYVNRYTTKCYNDGNVEIIGQMFRHSAKYLDYVYPNKARTTL